MRQGTFRLIIAALPLAAVFVHWETPRAQTAAGTYTFTRIAEHGFLQVDQGHAVPQVISSLSPSINDDGVVAFGHSPAASGRHVISKGDGRTPVQVYGGHLLTPGFHRSGIDGNGTVYLVENVTPNNGPAADWPCGVGVFGGCLFNSNRTVGLTTTLPFFLVNGAHPRLRIFVASDRVAYQLDSGRQLLTETGLIADDSLFLNLFDINTSGEVVFLRSSGISVATAGQPVRVVMALPGFNPRAPRIDDNGRVFFTGSEQGEQQWNVYRVDPGSQQPIKLIDGNNGPLRLTDTAAVAVNGAGSLVFLAERGFNGPRGIYTGPDPNSNKVIEVGDVLDGREVKELQLNPRAINNNGLDGQGQIVFAAWLSGHDHFSVYRADPPGASPANPIKPPPPPPGPPIFRFPRTTPPVAGGTVTYWDPPLAIGYEYQLAPGDPNFESVLLPSFPTHDTYELHLWNGTEYVRFDTPLTGDVEHAFGPDGVHRFRIMGIPESLGLDVNDPLAFVTGLRFVGAGSVELTMTPLTTPESTAPTTSISLTPTSPDGQSGWYRSAVHVTVSAGDENGGVAETRCVLNPANPPGTFDDLPSACVFTGAGADVTSDGTHTLYAASRGQAGNTESVRSASFKIDRTAPSVACQSPSVFTLNQANGMISASVNDTVSGPLAQTVTSSVLTSSVGSKSVQLTGFDVAGNTTTASCAYRVDYEFLGFSAPIENDGVLNVVKAGRGVPLKWQLLDAIGQPITTLTHAAITVQSLTCPAGTTEDQIEETVSGESGLQNLGGGSYQLNWKTSANYANSCKVLRLDLGEGIYRTALFKFTK